MRGKFVPLLIGSGLGFVILSVVLIGIADELPTQREGNFFAPRGAVSGILLVVGVAVLALGTYIGWHAPRRRRRRRTGLT